MSFSSKVKQELAQLEVMPDCCRHAQCYGMLLFSKSFSVSQISALSEQSDVIDCYCRLISLESGVEAQRSCTPGGKFKAQITEKSDIISVFNAFSCSTTELKKRINMGNLQNLCQEDEIYNCCDRAFLRGAFLACGAIADPNKNYHLEFSVPTKQLSADLALLLRDCSINAGTVARRGVYVVYIKDSTDIENLLNLMGAIMSELEFIQIKVQKSVKNKINRANNFEFANISRTAGAAADQLSMIELIKTKGTFEFLSDDLRFLAELREENPDASLNELGEMFPQPISRSAVNYKFKKLKEFSKKSREMVINETENGN